MNGIEEDYLDDDLELPQSTLQDLDRTAARLSQNLPQRHVSIDNRANTAVVGNAAAAPPSSDYGFDDEDVIDLDHQDDAWTAIVTSDTTNNVKNEQHSDDTNNVSNMGMAELQARLADLQTERHGLQKAVDEARADAMAKAGAISILRSKHEKSAAEFDRKLAVMQKLHADEIAKQKMELELVRTERETIKTNNQFLEHDLALELDRAKAAIKVHPHVSGQQPHQDLQPFGDGFDNDEVMVVSPPKSKHTPPKSRKRKRTDQSSPAVPLDIDEPPVQPIAEDVIVPPIDHDMTDQAPALFGRQSSLRVLQRVLDHQSATENKRTLELLAMHVFKNDANNSLAAIFLEQLSDLDLLDDQSLALDICFICMQLWAKCLEQEYYEPVQIILDLFEFTLCSVSSKRQEPLMLSFIPLASKSIDLVAVPRAVRARTGETTVDKSAPHHESLINVDLILDLLSIIACCAVCNSSAAARKFWSGMEFDFVLLMLNKAQPTSQIVMMLQAVAASVLQDSFGVVNDNDAQRQARNEIDTLDRLTSLLFEDPPCQGHTLTHLLQLAKLRLEILVTLDAIAATRHGSTSLAQHKTAIGRLVRFLHVQVTSLYDIEPNIGEPSKTETLHDIVIKTINVTTRMLYHLLHNHADMISVREKLAVIHGGHHKFLVAFSRIAFSERIAYEAGLEDEVVDAAHEILDAVLSPEEGDAVVQAVETPRTVNSRHSVSMSAPAPASAPVVTADSAMAM